MKKWSEEEVFVLKQNYNSVPNEELQKLFPQKTKQAIYKKAYKLGLRKTKEMEFLNRSISKRGERASNWNGGVRVTKSIGKCFLLNIKEPIHQAM